MIGTGLTHGWWGFAIPYASVQIPLLAAMARRDASAGALLRTPLTAVPLTLVAGLAVSAVTEGFGFSTVGLFQFAFGVGLSAGLGYAGGVALARREATGSVHYRGTLISGGPPRRAAAGDSRQVTLLHAAMERRMLRTAQSRGGQIAAAASAAPLAARAAEAQLARASRFAAFAPPARSGITLAGMPVSLQDETKHFKLVGTTGTGKSTAIQELLRGALARGDRAIIADPDYGYTRRFHDPRRGDVILNPFDPAARKWDLFGEINNTYDVEQLARSLIPDHGGSERSWYEYARTFFTAVTRQARAAGVADIGELNRLLMTAEPEELRVLLKDTPAQTFVRESNARMFDSIRSVASSAVAALQHVARQEAQPFSVRGWIRGGAASGGRVDAPQSARVVDPTGAGAAHRSQGTDAAPHGAVLFVPYRAGQIAALRSTVSAWMRLAIFEALNGPEGDQRLWFVVDELDALGQIDGLKDALARLRKFGGRCVLGFQSVAQVSSTYGAGDAHTIVENCGNSLLLRCAASEHGGTSDFASRLIGQREVLRTTLSHSRRPGQWRSSSTRSQQFNIEPAVLGSEIEQLPDLCGYLKLASSPQWQRVTLDRDAVRSESAHRGAVSADDRSLS